MWISATILASNVSRRVVVVSCLEAIHEIWRGAWTVSLISVVFACSPPAQETETNGTTPRRGGETDRWPRTGKFNYDSSSRDSRLIDRSEIKTFLSFFHPLRGRSLILSPFLNQKIISRILSFPRYVK